ncbi:hypothetical protein DPMN_073420 [Dreissena polymorpha]|uniref:Uncharacterized protein n=1 Tax=Dreissena polymorpha TaxID=45954 RepID=A0A9D4HB05_DREPO|nr:hypothetical protein DPMN_073420 [Dreissena polymorpha]
MGKSGKKRFNDEASSKSANNHPDKVQHCDKYATCQHPNGNTAATLRYTCWARNIYSAPSPISGPTDSFATLLHAMWCGISGSLIERTSNTNLTRYC